MLKVLSDILLAIDASDFSTLVLLDLSAAFDTVDHDILIQRPKTSYGLSGLVLQWFQPYFIGRCQYVRTGSSASSPTLIMCVYRRGRFSAQFFSFYTSPTCF